jgi:PAS domain S-box-containing protein
MEAEGRALYESLQPGRERFRLAFENAPIGSVVGLDCRMQRAIRTLCDALGYSERELLARTFIRITHPDDVQKRFSLGRSFSGEIPSYRLKKRFLPKDKRLVWLDLTALVVRGSRGESLYGLAMVENVYRAQARGGGTHKR